MTSDEFPAFAHMRFAKSAMGGARFSLAQSAVSDAPLDQRILSPVRDMTASRQAAKLSYP